MSYTLETSSFPLVEAAVRVARSNGSQRLRRRRPPDAQIEPPTAIIWDDGTRHCANCPNELAEDQETFCSEYCEALEEGIPIPNGRHCRQCGKELLALRRTYCDDRCQNKWHYEQRRLKEGKPLQTQTKSPDGTCARCGAALTGKQTRFCGPRCTSAFYEAQRSGREMPGNQNNPVAAVVPEAEPVALAEPVAEDRLVAAGRALGAAIGSGVVDEVSFVVDGWILSGCRQVTMIEEKT